MTVFLKEFCINKAYVFKINASIFNQNSFEIKDFSWIKCNQSFDFNEGLGSKDVLLDNKWLSVKRILHKQFFFL